MSCLTADNYLVTPYVTQDNGASPEGNNPPGKISSKTSLGPGLQIIRERYRGWLFDEAFPFWDRFGVDHENGGLFCGLDYDGNRVTDEKFMWYQGRGLWVYSHAYRRHGRNSRFLETARRTYEFLLRSGRDDSGLWWSSVGPGGEPIEGADLMGFAGMFAAEGMQEFARATGETYVLENALEAYRRTRSTFEDRSRSAKPHYLPLHYPGIRLLGHEMVFIRFLTQVLRQHEDPDLREALRQAVANALGPFFHPIHGLTSEALDANLNRPDDVNDDFFVLGHGMETMWMIMEAAVLLDDDEVLETAFARFRTHSEASWDTKNGGFRTALSLSRGALPGRLLWHHDEALIGNLMLYAMTGSDQALDQFLRIDEFTTDTFRVEGRSGPVWALEANDSNTPPAQVDRMGNYHLPRRLMLCLELFDAIERSNTAQGNISI